MLVTYIGSARLRRNHSFINWIRARASKFNNFNTAVWKLEVPSGQKSRHYFVVLNTRMGSTENLRQVSWPRSSWFIRKDFSVVFTRRTASKIQSSDVVNHVEKSDKFASLLHLSKQSDVRNRMQFPQNKIMDGNVNATTDKSYSTSGPSSGPFPALV